jgi:hypothetical protein
MFLHNKYTFKNNNIYAIDNMCFYVMLLISHGCCFIKSLHFGYELQEDFV